MGWLRRADEDAQSVPGVAATDTKAAGHVLALLSRAGVGGTRPHSTGVLSTEPVLVFWGEPRQNLGIYDQHGIEIGAAVRIKDRYSKVGYRYHYELRDAQLRCVLRDVTRRRIGIDSGTYAFSVLDAGGAEIGKITQSGKSNDCYAITSGGQSLASLRRVPLRKAMNEQKSLATPVTLIERGRRFVDSMTSTVWCIEDEPGHSVARITHLAGRGVAYVVAPESSLGGPLRTIALTVCMVADNRIIDARHRASGGG